MEASLFYVKIFKDQAMNSKIMYIGVWNILLVGTLLYLSLIMPIEWVSPFIEKPSFSLHQSTSGIALVVLLVIMLGFAAAIMSLILEKIHLIVISILLYLSMAIHTLLYIIFL